MHNQNCPFVSVIIPVFNDSERLKLCLEVLQRQSYNKNLYEVIVVDNGSDDDIKYVVTQFSQAYITDETKPGSYAARNKGISMAKGDVIAFTDSDCIPAHDWIEKGVANLLRVPNCGLVAGRIEIFFQDPEQPTAVELYEGITAFPQKNYVEELKFGATANLFTFRTVIDKVGLFNETLKSSGDLEWGKRVFGSGYNQVYADDTYVAHPARYSLNQLRNKIVRVIGGKYDLQPKKKYLFKGFIKMQVLELEQTLKEVFRFYFSKNSYKFQQKEKLKVVFVVLFVGYVRFLERLRLQFKLPFSKSEEG